jgi:uncharacterized membrane protein YccC
MERFVVSREESDRELEDLKKSVQRLRTWIVILGLLVALIILFEIPRDPTGLLLIGAAIVAFLAIGVLEKYGIG